MRISLCCTTPDYIFHGITTTRHAFRTAFFGNEQSPLQMSIKRTSLVKHKSKLIKGIKSLLYSIHYKAQLYPYIFTILICFNIP